MSPKNSWLPAQYPEHRQLGARAKRAAESLRKSLLLELEFLVDGPKRVWGLTQQQQLIDDLVGVERLLGHSRPLPDGTPSAIRPDLQELLERASAPTIIGPLAQQFAARAWHRLAPMEMASRQLIRLFPAPDSAAALASRAMDVAHSISELPSTVHIDADAVRMLGQIVDDSDLGTASLHRKAATLALVRIMGPSQHVGRLLHHGDRTVRHTALDAVRRFVIQDAEPWRVMKGQFEAIAQIGVPVDRRKVKECLGILQYDEMVEKTIASLRTGNTNALERPMAMPNHRIAEPVAQVADRLLSIKNRSTEDDDALLRAIALLGMNPHPRSVQTLARVLHAPVGKNPRLQPAAAVALQAHRSRPARQVLNAATRQRIATFVAKDNVERMAMQRRDSLERRMDAQIIDSYFSHGGAEFSDQQQRRSKGIERVWRQSFEECVAAALSPRSSGEIAVRVAAFDRIKYETHRLTRDELDAVAATVEYGDESRGPTHRSTVEVAVEVLAACEDPRAKQHISRMLRSPTLTETKRQLLFEKIGHGFMDDLEHAPGLQAILELDRMEHERGLGRPRDGNALLAPSDYPDQPTL